MRKNRKMLDFQFLKTSEERRSMLEIKGKYNTAKIFTNIVDEASVAQVLQLCNQECTEGSKIRLMPDIHAGAGCTIGTTMTIKDKVIPNLVGIDIGCGMYVIALMQKEIDLKKLDKLIYDKIPSGFVIREKSHPYAKKIKLEELYCAKHIDLLRAEKSVGTLGGGNHFIEVDQDDDGNLYLVIHSGSRHLGLEVANYYQNLGYHTLNGSGEEEIKKVIQQLKSEGKYHQIEATIKKMKNTKSTSTPKELAYVEGDLFEQYIHDMKIVQHYADLNRQAIAMTIVQGMNLSIIDKFTTIHNYIDTISMILRKGAVSARQGERLLIPINMRDGSLICVGKGNSDWNYSAPHGAGRLMSRSAAKREFSVTAFEKEMHGIYTTSVSQKTLDECPMAYKSMEIL